MYRLDLERAGEPEITLPMSVGSQKKQGNSKKTSTSASFDYAKAFGCVDHNKLWKILQEMGIPEHLTCLLRNLYAGQEATVRTGHGTTDCSKLGNEYTKDVYCHLAYLTYMQSTSSEIPGWMKHKLESRLPREKYQRPQICTQYHFNGRNRRGTEESLDEGERGE